MSQRPPWRMAVLYAQPRHPAAAVLTPPKTVPDFESAGACWVSAADVPTLPWRDAGDLALASRWFGAVAAGGAALLPLALPAEGEAATAFAGLAMM
jgi:hypothetical protein